MTNSLAFAAAGVTLLAATAAHACPDPESFDAHETAGQLAYDLLAGASYDVAIGGSIPWSDCGISGGGFLPAKASIRMDLAAAEGKSARVQVTEGCGTTYMFVVAGGYRGTTWGVAGSDPVELTIPRADIGNDQIVMVYLSSDAPGKVCEGKITFQTGRG